MVFILQRTFPNSDYVSYFTSYTVWDNKAFVLRASPNKDNAMRFSDLAAAKDVQEHINKEMAVSGMEQARHIFKLAAVVK